MKTRIIRINAQWLSGIFLLLILLYSSQATAAFKYVHEGMEISDFSGNDLLTGEKISFREYTKSCLPIIIFWSTWSPRSITQLEDMKQFVEKYKSDSIKVIAINVDSPNLNSASKNKIVELVKTMALPFPVIIDEKLEIFYSFGVIAVPSTAICDPLGQLRYGPSGYGYATRDLIIDSIEVFLGLKSSEILPEEKGYKPAKKSARYYNLALNLNKTGMFEQAFLNLNLASEADPKFPSPIILKSEILTKLERFDEADSMFQLAVNLDSNSISAWAGWGRSLLRSGQFEPAKEKLQKALTLDQEYTPAFLDYGLCMAGTGDLNAAIDSIMKAVDLNPGDPELLFYLGKIQRQANNNSEAVKSFLRAFSFIYPDD